MPSDTLVAAGKDDSWAALRARVRARYPGLLVPPRVRVRPADVTRLADGAGLAAHPGTAESAGLAGGAGLVDDARLAGHPGLAEGAGLADGGGFCACCRGPASPGYARCFHCGLHAESAPGLLADVVMPVAYAPKRGALARDLWLYKSARPQAPMAAAGLLALLLVFLHDHGWQAWRGAGKPDPTHVCVVPSCRGRPGEHPLLGLVSGCFALPLVMLGAKAGGDPWARSLDPDRFAAARPLRGAHVLLLDDTWVSGGTAQSAAVALKRAGSRRVTTVVLGRHVAGGSVPASAVPWPATGQPSAVRRGPPGRRGRIPAASQLRAAGGPAQDNRLGR